MTDPRRTLSDEDLSALLDGQAEPSVLDRLARDPEARARRDQLAAAAAQVSTPVAPLETSLVDQLVARALATGPTFEAGAPADPPAPPTAAAAPPAGVDGHVLALPPRPSRRLPPTWLVAAVVVLLVGIGLSLVWSGRDTGLGDSAADVSATADEPLASEATGGADEQLELPAHGGSAAPESSADAPDGEAPGEAGDPPATTTGSVDPDTPTIEGGPDLFVGTFPTVEDARTALATEFPAEGTDPGAAEAPTDAAFERCAEQMRVTLSLDEVALHQGWAEIDGEPVLAYDFAYVSSTDGSPTTIVTIVGVTACDPLALFER